MRYMELAVFGAAVLAWSTIGVTKVYGTRPLYGKDILAACSSDRSLDYCEGFLAAIDKQNGERFLNRTCPPALIRGDRLNWPRVRDYLAAKASRKNELATDILFNAESDELSKALGQRCEEKRK